MTMKKVVEWICYDDAKEEDNTIGSLGGFFKDGMRWPDYVDQFVDEGKEYAEAIRQDVIDKHIRLTGEGHQSDSHGVPVFEDGKCALFSWRAWGDLMAGIWSTEENKDYNYMDFYM
jgi:hypothetical protein